MSMLQSIHEPSAERRNIFLLEISNRPRRYYGGETGCHLKSANPHLAHGGGLAGLISRKGGPVIQQESDRWVLDHGPVEHGFPAYTSAGSLPCRYVIHAAGPIWGSGDEDEKLAAAVKGSLDIAESLGLKSIALPAISTGIFGFPKQRAARVIFDIIEKYFSQERAPRLELVRLTVFDQAMVDVFLKTWDDKAKNP